jgi:hypothetical protein
LGLARLQSFLRAHRRIALDNSIFIYHVERGSADGEFANEIFSWLEESSPAVVSSTFTLTALLVHPYRTSNEELVYQYYALISQFPISRGWLRILGLRIPRRTLGQSIGLGLLMRGKLPRQSGAMRLQS